MNSTMVREQYSKLDDLKHSLKVIPQYMILLMYLTRWYAANVDTV